MVVGPLKSPQTDLDGDLPSATCQTAWAPSVPSLSLGDDLDGDAPMSWSDWVSSQPPGTLDDARSGHLGPRAGGARGWVDHGAEADPVAASGETPMDIQPLRVRLGMQEGILDV